MGINVKRSRLKIRLIFAFNLLVCFASSSLANEVGKDYWVDAMKTALPTAFCQSMHFFRQCFDINEDQCIETASLATKICLHKYINQIPEILNQPKDGAKWGNIIGQCAGENYHATLSRKFKNNAECNNIDHWK